MLVKKEKGPHIEKANARNYKKIYISHNKKKWNALVY